MMSASLHSGRRLARSRANVLALMTDAGGTLADREAAALAEIVAPGHGRRRDVVGFGGDGPVAALVDLRTGGGRSVGQRKADLRIDRIVGATALAAKTGAGQKLARPVVAERLRHPRRALDRQRLCGAEVSRRAAGDAERMQEALRHLIGGLAG